MFWRENQIPLLSATFLCLLDDPKVFPDQRRCISMFHVQHVLDLTLGPFPVGRDKELSRGKSWSDAQTTLTSFSAQEKCFFQLLHDDKAPCLILSTESSQDQLSFVQLS